MYCNINSVYNNYRVLKLIGKGSYGQVYQVENDLNKKTYAMKTVFNNGRLSIRREFEILNQINNSNLIKLQDEIFNLNDNPRIFCMITEYCERGSLRDLINEKNNFDLELVFDWMKSIIDGLHYLHTIKIIHRDIKPGNILVDIDNKIKIADFGISRLDDDFSTKTPFRGTFYYMSPEMKANKFYDFKTDIWSTGCVLFELITLKKFKEFIENQKEDTCCIKTLAKLAGLLKLMLVKNQEDRADTEKIKKCIPNLEDEIGQEVVVFSDISDRHVFKSKIKIPSSFLPAQVPNFIGRKHVLEEIENIFLNETKQIIVLYSFAGTGKSTVASEFGYRFKAINKNYYSYWMKSDENNLYTEYAKLAEQMKIEKDASQNSESLIRKLNTKLHHLDEEIKILFILDNCDKYEDIGSYIKNLQRNTLVLITTRDSSFREHLREENSHIIYLQPFSQEECIEFMKKNLDNKENEMQDKQVSKFNEEDLIELLTLIGFSNRPYVLNKFAALIKLQTESKSLKTLTNEYKDEKVNDFRKIIQEDELFDLLVTKEPSSWKILKYSSFLDPDFIPIEIFTEMLNVNEEELADAIDLLKRISIVNKEEAEHFVGLKLHRALQDEIQQYLKAETKFSSKKSEINLLIEKFNEALGENFDLRRKKGRNKSVFYYNFKKIVEFSLSNDFIENKYKSEINHRYGNYLSDIEKFQNAIEYYNKANEFNQMIDNESDLAINLRQIGIVLNKQSKYNEALSNHEKAVQIFKRLNEDSEENEQVSRSFYFIALIYYNQANYEKAMFFFERSSTIRRNLGLNDPDTHGILGTIGSCYRNQGKYLEALKFYNESMNLLRLYYPNDENIRIAEILHAIGSIQRIKGQYEPAMETYQKTLEIKCKLFEFEKNASIATTLQNIGSIFCDLGRYDLSLNFFDKAISIYETIFENNLHLNVAVAYYNKSYVFVRLESYQEAAEYSYKSFLIFDQVLSQTSETTNPYYTDALSNSGCIYMKLNNDYQKALQAFEQSLENYSKIYKNEQNFNIGENLCNIAFCLFKLDFRENSKVYFEKSLEVYRNIYENDLNLGIADCLEYMSILYATEDQERSTRYKKDADKIRSLIYKISQSPNFKNCLEKINLDISKFKN